jgi:hypothetical protein
LTVALGVVAVRVKSPTTVSATVWVFAAGAPLEFPETTRLYCPGAVLAALFTVTVTVTGLPEVGLTDAAGAKLHVTPATGALQDNATIPLNGPSALTCTLNCELAPGTTLTLPGDALPSAKSTTFSETFGAFGAGAPDVLPETVRVYWPAGVPDVLLTVTVTVTGLFFVGLTLAEGEKLHVTPAAGELQVKFTRPLNDPEAPTCTVNWPLAPGNIVTADGDGDPTLKSTTLTVTGDWCVSWFESLPTPCTLKE